MKNWRKLMALLTAATMLTAILASCGGNDDSTADPVEEAPSATEPVNEEADDDTPAAGGTITFAASQNWIKDIERELAAEFEAETGIKVDFQLSPDDQYSTIITSKINTGEGPDIFMSYSGAKIRDYNPEVNAVDLSNESWVGGQKPWAIDGSSYDGTLYGFNECSADVTNGVLYQPAMFEEYDIEVPTDYESFKEACRILADNGVTPIYELVKDLWHAHYWMEGVATKALERDPDLYNKLNTNEIGFADVPEFVTALEQIKELSDLGYLGENHLSNDYDHSYEAIATGEYAMIIIHSSYPNEMQGAFDENLDETQFSMFPNPLADNTGVTLTAGGPTRLINAGSDNIEEAKLFFDFLARDDIAQRLYDGRTEFMEASREGISANPTVANADMQAYAQREMGPEAMVYFYDGSKISELMQELFVDALTAEELLEEFDSYRRDKGKDAGFEGF